MSAILEDEKVKKVQLNHDIAKNTIILSIQPKWLDLILSGKKTYEVRKTIPQCDYPIRVLMYCTKKEPYNMQTNYTGSYMYYGNGNIVGEFIVYYPFTAIRDEDNFNPKKELSLYKKLLKGSCLTYNELMAYVGNSRVFHFLKVDNLVIYDYPTELKDLDLKKAPQSWCYLP